MVLSSKTHGLAAPAKIPTKLDQHGKSGSRQPRSRFAPEYELLLRQLIAARKDAGVTQGEVAKALGKTQSHVSMCENREREISIMDLWKWCGALGITMTAFVQDFERNVTSRPGSP